LARAPAGKLTFCDIDRRFGVIDGQRTATTDGASGQRSLCVALELAPCYGLMKSGLNSAITGSLLQRGAVSAALIVITALLGACRSPPPTRAELLDKLRQCHDVVTQGKTPEWFISPCAKLDLTPLNGISRRELAATLGRPNFCMGLGEGGVPTASDCPPQWDPKWAFFRPPPSAGLGSGPELTCETDETQHCGYVHWLRPDGP
jgi:hypothetical protein